MTVLIRCDVCDDTFDPDDWEGLVMQIPSSMLAAAPADADEVDEYHICSWRCVAALANSQYIREGETETMELRRLSTPPVVEESYRRPEFAEDDAQNDAERSHMTVPGVQGSQINFQFGSTPLEKREQPTDEVPVGDITKDRRPVRLRKQDR